jgi:D-glycero-D-manno-heptose 1,7-bisphosphate phosphatase
MNRAVFLDRDGVINKKGGSYYIFRGEEFIFNQGLFEALRYLSSRGYLLIVITNQGGISKGIYTCQQTEELHKHMAALLGREGIDLSAVYYCPHHPDNEICSCRKPGSLLFEKAISEFNIDRSNSVMIGDSDIDIEAALKAGINGIKVDTNSDLSENSQVMSL